MKKIAVLFPGQGAQSIGMGKTFYDQFQTAREVINHASSFYGEDLTKLIFEENDRIHQTLNTQKAIITTSLSIYHVLKERLGRDFDATIGFSLGEYAALYAAGVFDFETTFELIRLRGIWMEEASTKFPGGMIALVGGSIEDIQKLCNFYIEQGYLCQIANFNSPLQKVLSCSREILDEIIEHASEFGIKRAVKLNVSGAFHSPFMSEAALQMESQVLKTTSNPPSIDIIMNATHKELDYAELAETMKQQMEGPVYFEDSVRHLVEKGIEVFIEVGPGNVLTSLIKKMGFDVQAISINEVSDLDKLGGIE